MTCIKIFLAELCFKRKNCWWEQILKIGEIDIKLIFAAKGLFLTLYQWVSLYSSVIIHICGMSGAEVRGFESAQCKFFRGMFCSRKLIRVVFFNNLLLGSVAKSEGYLIGGYVKTFFSQNYIYIWNGLIIIV